MSQGPEARSELLQNRRVLLHPGRDVLDDAPDAVSWPPVGPRKKASAITDIDTKIGGPSDRYGINGNLAADDVTAQGGEFMK